MNPEKGKTITLFRGVLSDEALEAIAPLDYEEKMRELRPVEEYEAQLAQEDRLSGNVL